MDVDTGNDEQYFHLIRKDRYWASFAAVHKNLAVIDDFIMGMIGIKYKKELLKTERAHKSFPTI